MNPSNPAAARPQPAAVAAGTPAAAAGTRDKALHACYPDSPEAVVCRAGAVLQGGRRRDAQVEVPADLPCNVIVVHGVNDVGTSYEQVEQGLCQGLAKRLGRTPFVPGGYRMPKPEDQRRLEDDPDAVYYKRTLPTGHRTPVIPFYWGFREEDENYKDGRKTWHGQALDRHGNRLDKDFSKAGGPFVNATTSLPDMWGPGKKSSNVGNRLVGDALRPVLGSPGRMYMILAAQRLAALVSMIRNWHADEVVDIVAHSQGCMLSLLAQAFLMEQGLRPADTLVLTHPPYSLVDDFPWLADAADSEGDADAAMKDSVHLLRGGQTFNARLTTLANIVRGVAAARHASPRLQSLQDSRYRGMVGARWQPDAPERDNRGKVYLYFCPEDTTVALDNVRGIGWQGVPEVQTGSQPDASDLLARDKVSRRPLDELGGGFFQRVFTARKRPDPRSGGPVLVGQATPHDHVLRFEGEPAFDHVVESGWSHKPRYVRTALPATKAGQEGRRREGVRRITGEPLPRPVEPDMAAGAAGPGPRPKKLEGAPPGALEHVDPGDAAIAVTQDFGYQPRWLLIDEPPADTAASPGGAAARPADPDLYSPRPDHFDGIVRPAPQKKAAVLSHLNRGKPPAQCCPKVLNVYVCLGDGAPAAAPRRLLVECLETPDEARLRWQQSLAPRSFHAAIFGSRDNHRDVTSYDLAIGGGRASSHAGFYEYLCAVADWRMTKNPKSKRPGVLRWDAFQAQHDIYWCVEASWRKKLIEGNAVYYSSGVLPDCLPLLHKNLPASVVCETMAGVKTVATGGDSVVTAKTGRL